MKQFLLTLSLTVMALAASAVPAKRGLTRTLTLADGTTVTAQLIGDEHGHYWLAPDGRAYQQLPNANFFAQVNPEAVTERANARRQRANARRSARLQQSQRVGEYGNYTGSKKGLIILVNYTDVTFRPANTPDLFDRIANEENFKKDRFVGSIHDYFYAQSEGVFDLTFDVVGPYTVSNTQAYYGGNDRQGNDLRPAEMVIEACQLADPDVNYPDYDWDGDGFVDQVYVIYAGNGEADSNVSNSIWPHEWDLASAAYYGDGSGTQTLDGVRINTYACGGELNGSNAICGIGTMCHEFSHCLGFPDFYDTGNGRGRGMDMWDLMDVGSYNGNGYRPAGYTSYERWMAGWKTPIELDKEPVEVTAMKSLQEGGESYIIYNDGNHNEYFLLENRRKTEWDAGIPGNGLLILHVDYSQSAWYNNTVNNTASHQRMTWVAADNQYQTSGGYLTTNGMATDPYPYAANNSFGNLTSPAATLFNKNTDGSTLLNKIVYEITRNSDGTVSFLYANSPDVPIEITGDGDYRRVVSTDSLTEDATYLLVYEASRTAGTAYAGINTTSLVHYGKKVDVDIDGFTISSDDAVPLRLKRASDDSWYLLDGDNYVCWHSGNSLTSDPIADGQGFTWTITDEGIVSTDFASSNRRLQYNPTNTGQRFACYRNTQKDVVLYMKAEEPDPRHDAALAYAQKSLTVEAETADFAEPELQNPNNLSVVYSSSDEQLATVDAASGQVTIGATPGQVIITATFPGDETFKPAKARYRITITAKPKQEAQLSFSVEELSVEAETADFVEPELQNPNNLPVSYSSSDEQLATVDASTGQVTIGATPGQVTITASFPGDDQFNPGQASYLITITAKPKQEAQLSFSVEELSVEAETADFVEPELLNPNNLPVAYSSSDEQLATVDAASGQVTIGATPGQVTITASFPGNDQFNSGQASYLVTITQKQDVGIRQMENGKLKMDNAPVYDLSGRKIVNRKSVNRKLPKGLYIRGGKKIIANP